MSLYQLHFLSPSASFNFPCSSKPKKWNLKRNFHKNPVHGVVISASSAEKPSRKKKGRPSRALMSDEDLCKQLREVMSVAGLPADRVPLMKELCEHGRKDLANIVRRRGYKVVRLLLSTSNLSDNHNDNSSVEDQERRDPQGDEASVSGTNRDFHVLEEEQLPSSDQVINQEKRIETIEDLASNMNFYEDNRTTKIGDLKDLLHEKEMELVELKQHIEKQKQALALLQARARNEIGNVHRVMMTKDAELSASKDKLSGLKEVQLQFRVNGEIVEVAGSFNGWHKQIKMNLHPSSKTVDLQGSRASKLWSTILWLYPGTYEIKFIVDGQWMIDPQREVATNGHITNNVLRVDRRDIH
ncbi:protein PTST homolog 3, chloroplastic isoform X2 [Dendrobium catenatum]|uniref:protein PTST homolog 3, chloroplastic isoform X2 n=1 Tax=Dendrobium catenatum TaxID=906689 RepID=UPI00109F0C95|nr:protein PTST homolog 3, chloroplastic isoform X2 [Dendrobium catenatum]